MTVAKNLLGIFGVSAGLFMANCGGSCVEQYTEVVVTSALPGAALQATITPQGGNPAQNVAITGTVQMPQRVSVGSAVPQDFCITTASPGMWTVEMGLAGADGKRPVSLVIQGGVETCFPHTDIYRAFVPDRSECENISSGI